MTVEDAIRIIEKWDTSNSEENIEAKRMAIEALRKQIPESPMVQESTEKKHFGCPVCKRIYLTTYKDKSRYSCGRRPAFCEKCGQAIEWRE